MFSFFKTFKLKMKNWLWPPSKKLEDEVGDLATFLNQKLADINQLMPIITPAQSHKLNLEESLSPSEKPPVLVPPHPIPTPFSELLSKQSEDKETQIDTLELNFTDHELIKEENQLLTHQLKNTRHSLKQMTNENKTLIDELDALKIQINNIKNNYSFNIAILERKIEKLSSELHEAQTTTYIYNNSTEAIKVVNKLNEANNSLNMAVNAEKSYDNFLFKIIPEITQHIIALEKSIEDLKDKRSALTDAKKLFRDNKENNIDQYDILNNDIKLAEARLIEHESNLKTILTSSNASFIDLQQKIMNNSVVTPLSEHHENISSYVTACMETLNNNAIHTAETYNKEISDMQQNIKKLKTSEKILKDLQHKHAKLKSELESLQELKLKLETENGNLTEKLSSFRERHAYIEKEGIYAQNIIKDASNKEKELSRLKDTIEVMIKKEDELSSKLTQVEILYQTQKNRLTSEISKINNTNQVLNDKVLKQKSILDSYTKSTKTLENKTKMLNAENADLKEKISYANGLIAKLSTTVPSNILLVEYRTKYQKEMAELRTKINNIVDVNKNSSQTSFQKSQLELFQQRLEIYETFLKETTPQTGIAIAINNLTTRMSNNNIKVPKPNTNSNDDDSSLVD